MIGRNKELAELENRWNSGRFELGVVYGTRRIGKTTLIMCMNLQTNLQYIREMTIWDFLDQCIDYKEISEDMKKRNGK